MPGSASFGQMIAPSISHFSIHFELDMTAIVCISDVLKQYFKRESVYLELQVVYLEGCVIL